MTHSSCTKTILFGEEKKITLIMQKFWHYCTLMKLTKLLSVYLYCWSSSSRIIHSLISVSTIIIDEISYYLSVVEVIWELILNPNRSSPDEKWNSKNCIQCPCWKRDSFEQKCSFFHSSNFYYSSRWKVMSLKWGNSPFIFHCFIR